MWYNFSIKETVKRLLHPKYRKPKLMALIYALLTPARRMMARFKSFEQDTEYILRFGGSLSSFQQYLNDRFGFTANEIYIENAVPLDPIYHGWLGEPNTKAYYSQWLDEGNYPIIYQGFINEFNYYPVDFMVMFPSASFTQPDLDRLTAYVNQLKLVSKRACIFPY